MATEFKERKRWIFLGLPFTFTTYTIREDMITIDSGIFNRVENDCYMYKVKDVELRCSFGERLFKLGTIVCYTGDTTHPKLEITHIKNAKSIKDYILEVSETERLKHRTLNTLDIGDGGLGQEHTCGLEDPDDLN